MRGSRITFWIMCIVWCIIIHYAFGQATSQEKVKQDTSLIVPGLGSDSILLGNNIDDIVRRFGKNKFRISRPSHLSEIFKNVFNVSSRTKIYFDVMYYNDEDKFAVCVYKGGVAAVIGFNNERITIDSVNLQRGVNNFIFYYGNKNLLLIRTGSHGIYMYRERGIAVIDDEMNDSIDLYIVFTPAADN